MAKERLKIYYMVSRRSDFNAGCFCSNAKGQTLVREYGGMVCMADISLTETPKQTRGFSCRYHADACAKTEADGSRVVNTKTLEKVDVVVLLSV